MTLFIILLLGVTNAVTIAAANFWRNRYEDMRIKNDQLQRTIAFHATLRAED